MGHSSQEETERRWRRSWWGVLFAGSLVQIWFWLRSIWIYLDQVELYELGMVLVREGRLLPFGKLSTGNLPIPGAVLELLTGLPLMAWLDLRAPTLVLILFHLTAVIVVSRILARDFDWRFATVYLAILWLSPWRLFHSAFLWETNYLLLPAAAHLASCRVLRAEKSFAASGLLAATLLLTLQIHGSVVILGLSTAFLLLGKRLFLDWRGVALGSALGSVTLWPTVTALLRGQGLPAQPEAAATLLVRLNSVEKALVYWLRLPSLDVGRRYRQSLFCVEPGSGDKVPEPFLCHLVEITQILALASVVVALAAGWWFFRRYRPVPSPTGQDSIDKWYRHYSWSILLAVLVSALLSPVLIQGWHVLVALVIACLPVTAWIHQRWATAGSALRAIMVLFVLWRVPASLLLLGHPMYAQPTSLELPRHIAPENLRVLIPGSPRE